MPKPSKISYPFLSSHESCVRRESNRIHSSGNFFSLLFSTVSINLEQEIPFTVTFYKNFAELPRISYDSSKFNPPSLRQCLIAIHIFAALIDCPIPFDSYHLIGLPTNKNVGISKETIKAPETPDTIW